MTKHDQPCFVCGGDAHYDAKKGEVVCDKCGKGYFDACTCKPQE